MTAPNDTKACTHDLGEMDAAAHFDGLCPLCQQAELQRLRALVHDVEAITDEHAPCANDDGDLRDRCSMRIEINDRLAKFARGE